MAWRGWTLAAAPALVAVGCHLALGIDGLELVDDAPGGASHGGSNTGAGGTGGSTGGTGGTGGVACDPATCPVGATECEVPICDINDQCALEDAALGTACTDTSNPDAQVCDAAGTCVECNSDADCNTPAEVCDEGATVCVPAACVDGELNGSETDLDCGGAECGATCHNGQFCNDAGDCVSGFCDTGAGTGGNGQAGVCAPCGVVGDCQAGEYCDSNDVCVAQVADGTTCNAAAVCADCAPPDMCSSGNCADGVCCDTACTGTCLSCLAAQTASVDGVCDDIDADTDPKDECTDGLFCTGDEMCNGSGACASSPGNPCTGHNLGPNCSDSCNEGADSCTGPDSNTTTCNDNLFCTQTDMCNGSGSCVGTGNPCSGHNQPPNCNDSCDENNNNCNGNDSNTTTCNDNLFCTATDLCNGSGNCVGTGNPCSGHNVGPNCNDSCNEGTDLCNGNDSNTTACDDGLFCTETDLCNGSGTCVGAGNPCTPLMETDADCSGSCHEGLNNCSANDPNGTGCVDTGADTCCGGTCVDGVGGGPGTCP